MHIARYEVEISPEWQAPPQPNLGKAVALAMHPAISDRAFVWFKASEDGQPMRARRFIIVRDWQSFDQHARHVSSAVTDEGGFHLFQMAP